MYKALSAPLVVQIEATYRCPCTCLQCYNFWRAKADLLRSKLQDDLSMDQMNHIVDQLIGHKVFHAIMTGGEPLVNKQVVFRGVEKLRQAGISVGINSTLIPLKFTDAKFLKDVGVSGVLTSLLGPNATSHDRMTQKPGSFERTLLGIRTLQKAEVPVTVNMVVSQINLHLLEQTAALVKSLGLKSFCSTRAACPANCTDYSGLALTLDEFRSYLNRLHKVGSNLGLAVDVLESYPLCGMKEIGILSQFTGRRCLAGVTSLTVGPDCQVRPCSHMDESYGNLVTEELGVIWARMHQWRTGALLPKTCQSCELVTHCGGGCRMEAKMIKGAITEMDPYASPLDVPYALSQLPTQERAVNQPPLISFYLNNHARWRREKFGSIVFLGQRSACFLNETSTSFLEGLTPNQIYQVEDVVSDYGDHARDFLSGLQDKHVIIPA